MKPQFFCAALVLSIAVAAPAFAVSINTVETTLANGTTGVTLDQNPVIDFIASQPGSLDGFTYTNYALITADTSGSLEIFGHLPAGSTYVPTVGDAISVTGEYSPFDSIPELETLTAISQVSTGNAVPAPVSVTIPQLNAAITPPNFALSEFLVTVPDVTLSGATTFLTHGNTSLTATDASGNTLTVFQWASSYMAAGALGGTPVPTGSVDMTGIFDTFDGAPEFIPFSFAPSAAAPEPASLGILGIASVAMILRRRRHA